MHCEPLGIIVPDIDNYREVGIIIYDERHAKSIKKFLYRHNPCYIAYRIAICLQKEVTIRSKFKR
jgi:hypothetical protein